MENNIASIARKEIKDGLKCCTESNINLFKRMYSHKNLHYSINEVIDNMPDEKLDIAMRQINRTLEMNLSELNPFKKTVIKFLDYCKNKIK